jgi:ribulose-5-phosphate 4-epimerase/fuculose-1-phosphate aldolase
MNIVNRRTIQDSCDQAEWEARVDLAAAHRMAVIQGFSEGIRNHLTLSVPGHDDQVLIMPFGLHWSEVKASSFLVVDLEGRVLRGEGEVERSTFCLHVPLHHKVPHAKAVFHTHMPFATTLTRLENPRLLPIGQTEVGMMSMVAYDEKYTGLGFDVAEGYRIAEILGSKSILFMANHGVMVTGRTVSSAYEKMFYLERACQSQVQAMWTGQRLKMLPDEIVAHTQAQFSELSTYYGVTGDALHFQALRRMLDRADPGYAT